MIRGIMFMDCDSDPSLMDLSIIQQGIRECGRLEKFTYYHSRRTPGPDLSITTLRKLRLEYSPVGDGAERKFRKFDVSEFHQLLHLVVSAQLVCLQDAQQSDSAPKKLWE